MFAIFELSHAGHQAWKKEDRENSLCRCRDEKIFGVFRLALTRFACSGGAQDDRGILKKYCNFSHLPGFKSTYNALILYKS